MNCVYLNEDSNSHDNCNSNANNLASSIIKIDARLMKMIIMQLVIFKVRVVLVLLTTLSDIEELFSHATTNTRNIVMTGSQD